MSVVREVHDGRYLLSIGTCLGNISVRLRQRCPTWSPKHDDETFEDRTEFCSAVSDSNPQTSAYNTSLHLATLASNHMHVVQDPVVAYHWTRFLRSESEALPTVPEKCAVTYGNRRYVRAAVKPWNNISLEDFNKNVNSDLTIQQFFFTAVE